MTARSAFGTAVDDQQKAAEADVRANLAAVSDELGLAVDDVVGSRWVQGQLLRLGEGLRTGRIGRCQHLRSPRPSAWLLWAPGLLRCLECVLADGVLVDPVEDRRCDQCRRGCEAAEMHVGLVAAGSTFVSFGLCRGCAARAELPSVATR